MNEKIELWTALAWPLISAVFNVAFRFRTPEEWIAFGEKWPRVAGLIRLVRATGVEPVKMLSSLQDVVKGAR